MNGTTMYPRELANINTKRIHELHSIIEEMETAAEKAESNRLDGTTVEGQFFRPLGTCQVRLAQLLIDLRQDLKFDQFVCARKLPRVQPGEEQ